MLLTLVFVAAWAVSPGLRAWIERPKYRFQDGAERTMIGTSRSGGAHP